MNFIFIILTLTAVLAIILWILFKPKKKRPKKKSRLNKNSALKNKALSKKQESIDSVSDQTRRKKAAQMKKDPEIISRALSYWLNQKE